ncbi:hypothetical protein A3E39_02045 [Candidatus Uhrbacteria bacterium RIFCSPHIGHO2_12_FULL_60_25]|uniref:Uncharacterized protein n=1 Tax=Candidatus Uhrbacteria bacterium RIFCSPHIGHO2_12_FULL_60_25 TaxID=1802399 RepID=A0A1F7UJX3_9BACT|nr:MAG: hypothetical protein A3E39_02045 [Candidatus Uhrbacteria bacterium RIFCSPHIGHO2_12_FULL_60_25]
MKRGLWILAIALVPTATQAADICCSCKGPPDPAAVTCLTADAKALGSSADDCTAVATKTKLPAGWTCDTTPLTEQKCKTVSDGGVCPKAPTSAYTYAEAPGEAVKKDASKQAAPIPDIIPTLNVPIPGLTFTGGSAASSLFGEYIAALYRYAISIAAIAATVMFVFGAFQFLLGSAVPQINKGRAYMIDAVVGLLLVMGATLILRTVNPALVSLEALNITLVGAAEDAHPFAPAEVGGPAQKSKSDDIAEGAKLAGGDPCAVLAFCEHESGLRFTWNGYPRNPVENSKFWGPCSGGGDYLGDGGNYDKKLRKQFPDIWPPLGQDLPKSSGLPLYLRLKAKADILLSNGIVAGYLAAHYAKSTVDSIIGAGIGSANITRWRTANGCKAQKLTLAQATDMGFNDVVTQACVPFAAVGNGGGGCPGSLQHCEAADPEGLKKTKGYEISKGGQINGICTGDGGKKCFTIWSQDHLRYVLKSYKRFDAKYHCTAKSK